MTVAKIADKIVVFLENKTAMIYKPTVAIAYMYNLRQVNQIKSINQLYLNTVNGSASWFSDMPCDNYNL